MNNNWKIRLVEKFDRFGFGLYIYRENKEERIEVKLSDGKVKVYDKGMDIEPTIFLDGELFQELVNAIHKDFKPSEGKYTEGKLDAQGKHLEDLRKLLKLK